MSRSSGILGTWPVHLSCASFTSPEYVRFASLSSSGPLPCHLIFNSFLSLVKTLGMTWYTVHVSHAYKRVGSTIALLNVSLVSSLIPFHCQTLARSHTSFRSSGSNLTINVHDFGESVFQIAEFINNLQFYVLTAMIH